LDEIKGSEYVRGEFEKVEEMNVIKEVEKLGKECLKVNNHYIHSINI
jgi:hypothetical protein